MEKITAIIEEEFKLSKDDWESYEGVTIITDKQKIYLGISSGQCCCEDYGYITSEDDYTDYIGAEIKNVYVTDTLMNSIDLDMDDFDYGGGAIFINIETNKGTLQFVAYNAHNGYYGHDVRVKSSQLDMENCI